MAYESTLMTPVTVMHMQRCTTPYAAENMIEISITFCMRKEPSLPVISQCAVQCNRDRIAACKFSVAAAAYSMLYTAQLEFGYYACTAQPPLQHAYCVQSTELHSRNYDIW
eukprot:6476-Heterococcus_DN1.PRE.1